MTEARVVSLFLRALLREKMWIREKNIRLF
jgi:hypothetical protein